MSSDRDANLETIGPYEVVEVLGEGGMGVVYRARQVDPIEREVALKLIRPGVASERVVARFQAERQSLAVMEHPSIATILDAGTTDDGRPYFVMELVRGTDLLRYADERRLGLRERVAMMIQVCHGVQHAHRKGVIHRDLKPSNIIVTESGEGPIPKIIDFGIAKVVDPDGLQGDGLTQANESTGTPAYMSPEQMGLLGQDVDTRTDVFSLGVILYQLLVGELPFEESAYRGWAPFVSALTRDPPRPSRRFAALPPQDAAAQAAARSAGPGQVVRWLERDLDWIIGRAMEKEPDRRYETVNGLAMDLRRFLDHEPVDARPPSRMYRARKLVRRNPLGAGLGAALVVLLAAFAGVQTYQARVIAGALEETELRKGQAEDLIDYTLGDLRGRLEPLGRLDILDDVSEQAMRYFASLPTEEFDDQELIRRSEALNQLGQVRLDQGDRDEALELFRESVRLYDALGARDPSQGDWQFARGQALWWLGYAHYVEGRMAEAEVPFREYLAIAERLVEIDDTNLDWVQELSYAHSNMGSLHEARGDLNAAADAFALTLSIDSMLVRLEPDDPDRMLDFARSHNTLAVVYQRLARLEEAAALHASEVSLKTALAAADPQNMIVARDLARSRRFLGMLYTRLGRTEGARVQQEAAVETLTYLRERDPSDVELARELGGALARWGLAIAEAGDPEEGAEVVGRALDLLQELRRRDPSHEDWARILGEAWLAEARARELSGSVAGAAESAGRAVTILDPLAAEGSPTEVVLAAALVTLGRVRGPEEGAVHLERAATVLDAREGDDLASDAVLAEALLRLGRPEEAAPALGRLDAAGYAGSQLVAARTRATAR